MAHRPRRHPHQISVFDPDFVRLALKKNPAELTSLAGFNLWEATDQETGVPSLYHMLSQMDRNSRGRAPWVIPIATDQERAPAPDDFWGDRLVLADIGENPETGAIELTRKHKEKAAVREFRSGLININGGTRGHLHDISTRGGRLGYHGPIPLTRDAAKIVGESIEIGEESKIHFDDRVGKLNGIAGVPRRRVVTIEGMINGPILYKTVDGQLTIHTLTKGGWADPVDVTGIKQWEQAYLDEMMKDTAYLAALAEDEGKALRHKQRPIRIIRPPIGHPDE